MEMLFVLLGMLVLMLLKVPIVFSMGLAAAMGLIINGDPLTMVPQRMYGGIDSFTILSIPFFVFVGEVMNTGGVTNRIFSYARAQVGHIKGGLGHVNILSSIIFAGMSGSSVSDAYGLGLIEIKAMEENGFDTEFAAAVTAASATIGPVIPPSIPLVIFAVIAEESVGRLFMGGVIPGLLMGLSLMILVYFISHKRGYKTDPKTSFKEKLKISYKAFPSLMTPVFMFVTITFGIVTPTEAAAAVGVYALVLGFFIHREMTLKELYQILIRTVKNSASILIIISAASILSWVVLTSSLPGMITNGLSSLTSSPSIMVLLICVLAFILGMFMEGISIIMIIVPLILPTIHLMNINIIHFGVVFVLTVMLGNVTPPVGLCLYVTSNIAGISFERMSKAILPFLVPLLIVVVILVFFPGLITFLPKLLLG